MRAHLSIVLFGLCLGSAWAQSWFFLHQSNRTREQTGPTALSDPKWQSFLFFNDSEQIGYTSLEVTRPAPLSPIELSLTGPFEWRHASPVFQTVEDFLDQYPSGLYSWQGVGPSGPVSFVTATHGGNPPFANPLFTNWSSWRTVQPSGQLVLEFQNFQTFDQLDQIWLEVLGPSGQFVFGTSLFPSFTSFSLSGSLFQEHGLGTYTAAVSHRRFTRYAVSPSQFGYVWLDSRTVTSFEVVPEPATLAVLGMGMLAFLRRLKR